MIALALGPAFIYPSLYLAMLCFDTLLGDRVIIDQWLHVSKRDIWELFWSDWLRALPACYLAGVPVVGASLLLRQRLGVTIWLTLPGLAVLAAVIVTLGIYSGSYTPVMIAAALIFAIPATGIVALCSR